MPQKVGSLVRLKLGNVRIILGWAAKANRDHGKAVASSKGCLTARARWVSAELNVCMVAGK